MWPFLGPETVFRLPRHVPIASLLVVAAGCAAAGGGVGKTTPLIRSIDPPSGLVGVAYPVEIVLTGENFAEADNAVRFGDIVLDGLPSTDNGTRIVFLAPKERRGGGEAPPMILQPGRYPVSVTTPAGTSPAVEFVLVREAGLSVD